LARRFLLERQASIARDPDQHGGAFVVLRVSFDTGRRSSLLSADLAAPGDGGAAVRG
jgi:hypothetical protein